MNTTKHKKLKWMVAMLATPIAVFAQETQKETTTYFSNALFNTLLVIIILLLIVVLAIANVLKNLSQSEYFQERYKKNKSESNTTSTTTLGLLVVFSLLANQLVAQNTKVNSANSWLIGGLDGFTFYFMMLIIFIEGIAIFSLLNVIKGLTKSDKVKDVKTVETAEGKIIEVKEKTILDKLNASVDIENEAEIMLDHDYDGIKELDNNLPPWWKYGFYLTIVIGVIYLINFHVSATGDLQDVEYKKEIAEAKLQVEEYMKTSANNVDETTVKLLDNASDLASGKDVFIATCVACHGKLGEGGVGPNLTDAYWLHSGGVADIFKSIKYGWPDKGMKSWKEDLSPIQIAQVTSYIKTLAGTNPPNGKAPQGDVYVEEGKKATTDSTAVIGDSLVVKEVVKDSLSVKK